MACYGYKTVGHGRAVWFGVIVGPMYFEFWGSFLDATAFCTPQDLPKACVECFLEDLDPQAAES